MNELMKGFVAWHQEKYPTCKIEFKSNGELYYETQRERFEIWCAALSTMDKVGVIQDGVLRKAPARKKWLSEKQDKGWWLWWQGHEGLEVVYVRNL